MGDKISKRQKDKSLSLAFEEMRKRFSIYREEMSGLSSEVKDEIRRRTTLLMEHIKEENNKYG